MKAHQRLVREKKEQEESKNILGKWWKKIDTDIKKAVVKEIDYKQAKSVIEEYEWLGCMPAMVKYCFGIFFDNHLGGVVVYSHEYSENLGHWDKYLSLIHI